MGTHLCSKYYFTVKLGHTHWLKPKKVIVASIVHCEGEEIIRLGIYVACSIDAIEQQQIIADIIHCHTTIYVLWVPL